MSARFVTQTEVDGRVIAAARHAKGPLLRDDAAVIEPLLTTDGRLRGDRLGAGMRQIGTMVTNAAELFISMVASSLRAATQSLAFGHPTTAGVAIAVFFMGPMLCGGTV
jgi:hypothetical protein